MPLIDTISPEHQLALPAGYQLGEYRILKVLGQGGFGITYLAEDTRLNHQVAIKELLPKDFATRSVNHTIVPLSQADEPDLAWAKESFLGEARFLVKLNHPNVVRFFRYFELNDTAYLVMEFVRGQNFKAWMQSHQHPSEKELKALLLRLLEGLEYVHQQGLLHRDISPENVIITEEGRPMLLDFGSARAALGTNPKTEVVRRGFSPIEQYQRNSPQGPYTDLYAMAGIMIQAVSGEPPPDSIDRFGSRDPYQPVTRRLRGRYSESFLRALDAAFAALPKDRPQSVARWRALLEISNRTRPAKRVRPALIWAAAALGLLICGILYYLASAPKTLVVPDQYSKIQLAIDAARAGDTVLVKAGIYDEALIFKNGIKLRGADRDTTIVSYHALPKAASKFDSTPPLSIYHCQAGEVNNLTFQQVEPDPRGSGVGWKADAITIAESTVTIENCSASSAAGDGIAIYGASSAPNITGNRCDASNLSGIVFSEAARGEAAQNICEKNKYHGIMVSGTGTNPVLTGNQCRANTHDGIQFSDGSQGKAIDNLCEKNDANGISLQGSSPFLSGNQLRQNGMYGLLYDSSSKYSTGKLNIISGNRLGETSVSTPASTPTPVSTPASIQDFLKPLVHPRRLTLESPTPTPTPKATPTPTPFDLSQWTLPPLSTPAPAPTPKATPTPFDFSQRILPPKERPLDGFVKDFEISPTPTPNGTPLSAQGYYDRAEIEAGKKEYQQAIEDLSETLRMDPDDAAAYNERGRAYLNISKYNEAFADFDKALNLVPKEAIYYYNRGLAGASLEKFTQAINDYTKAITLKPDYAHPYRGRGDVSCKLKRYKDAVKDYTEAIRLDPKSGDAYQCRGDAYSKLGLDQQAKIDYAKAKELLDKQ